MLMLGSWGWLWGRLVSDGERTERGQITQPVVVWQGVYAPSDENGPHVGGRRAVECWLGRGGEAEKSGGEGGAAAATGGGVGVFEDKAAGHDFVFEIDGGAAEIEETLGVADDLDAVLLEDLVGFLVTLGEIEDVGEAGATTTLDAYA